MLEAVAMPKVLKDYLRITGRLCNMASWAPVKTQSRKAVQPPRKY